MTIDFDDFGANHIISDQCQSHDCRDKLDELHVINPKFKVTLFAIPGEMTVELMIWCLVNSGWIELAYHGFFHSDNWECSEMTYENFDRQMKFFDSFAGVDNFVTGFKAPGWQISDGAYKWLLEHNWWVADQAYNNERRPKGLKSYILEGDQYNQKGNGHDAYHGHTWDCVGNGIYETFEDIAKKIENVKEFKFVSEVV